VAERGAEVARIATALRAITSPSMKSDLTTAVALANAAVAGAIANVEINLESIKPDSVEGEAFVLMARGRAAALKADAAL
jgi:formiminotetrahydrofolate cyclodeaminase